MLLVLLVALAVYLNVVAIVKLVLKDYNNLTITVHVIAITTAYLFWFFVFMWR